MPPYQQAIRKHLRWQRKCAHGAHDVGNQYFNRMDGWRDKVKTKLNHPLTPPYSEGGGLNDYNPSFFFVAAAFLNTAFLLRNLSIHLPKSHFRDKQ